MPRGKKMRGLGIFQLGKKMDWGLFFVAITIYILLLHIAIMCCLCNYVIVLCFFSHVLDLITVSEKGHLQRQAFILLKRWHFKFPRIEYWSLSSFWSLFHFYFINWSVFLWILCVWACCALPPVFPETSFHASYLPCCFSLWSSLIFNLLHQLYYYSTTLHGWFS